MELMKKRKIKSLKFPKIKDKIDKFGSDEESPIGRFKYKSSNLLDKTKQILGGYKSLDDTQLLKGDMVELQSDLKGMFSDIRREEKEEKKGLVWESLSAEKTIKRSRVLKEKIINLRAYWISEFRKAFKRYLLTYSLSEMVKFVNNPMKFPVLARLYEKIQPSPYDDNFILLYY